MGLDNNLTFTISLDACASMLQIISIICQNKKLGELTNIQKNNKNKILDVYSYIKDVIEQNDKSIYVTEYKEILLNRSFIKQCIMTNIYGSTPWAFSKKMVEDEQLILFEKTDTRKMAEIIIKNFYIEFPEIKTLKKIIRYIGKFIIKDNESKNNLKITISHPDGVETQYTVMELKTIRVDIKKDEEKKIGVSFNYKTEKTSSLETVRGLFPNLIHSIDSQILHKTRVCLYNKNISTLGIHDCILIENTKYKECLEEYNKNINFLIDNNINIFKYLNINEEEFIKYINIELKYKKKDYKEIIDFINLNKSKKLDKINLSEISYSLLPA